MRKARPVKTFPPEAGVSPSQAGVAADSLLDLFTHQRRQRGAVLLGLLLFGLIVWEFWPSVHCGFLFWDDSAEILTEPHVNGGLTAGNIAWAVGTLEHCNWYPLNWLSHMLDCEVYGLEPWGHHLTSVVFHALNSVLVFVVMRKLTGAVWRSLAVAMIFGVHPLRVQSVSWICERKDVLSMLFWMLTLWGYAQYAQGSKAGGGKVAKYYGMALIFFGLGLMSKAMVVTLPMVLLLVDYWPLGFYPGKGWGRLVLEKVPFMLLAAGDGWITLKAQQASGITGEMGNLSLSDKVGNALMSYVRYLGKFFWPEKLSIYYPHPGQWAVIEVMGAGIIVVGITVWVIWLRGRKPYLVVGWLWYVGTLVPVIGLVQLLSQSMADRYTYIPMVGFAMSLVWLLEEVTRGWRYRAEMAVGVGALVMIACVARTREEIGYYKDDVTLWRRAVAVTEGENNWCPHYSLGVVFLKTPQHDAALAEFQESVRINPNYSKSQLCLAQALEDKYRFDEAMVHYQRALELDPNRGMAWFSCGLLYVMEGELDEAIGCFKRAVQCEPNKALFHKALDAASGCAPWVSARINELREALKQNPDRPDLLNNLAWQLATNPDPKLRNGVEAVQLAERACQLTHYQNTVAVSTLAAAYAVTGRFEEAITNAQLASSLASRSGDTSLLKKNKMMLGLFRAHLPYYGILIEH